MKDNLGWDLGVQLKYIPSKKHGRCGVVPKGIKLNALQLKSLQAAGRTTDVFVGVALWAQRWAEWSHRAASTFFCFVHCFGSYLIRVIADLHNAQPTAPATLL